MTTSTFRAACLLALSILASACDCGTPGIACKTTPDCPAGQLCIQGLCLKGKTDGGAPADAGSGPVDGGLVPADVVGLEVAPATATLTVSAPAPMPTQDFSATLLKSDGSRVPNAIAVWSVTPAAFGDIDSVTGRFTANGLQAGTATVTATVGVVGKPQPLSATATVVVKVALVVNGPGAPADAPSRFAALQPFAAGSSANVLYPLDRAVMPQNVFPADVQWDEGQSGDLFRLTLQKPDVTVTAYLLHDGAAFLNHWQAAEGPWRAFAQSNPDVEGTLTVDRWVAATQQAFAGKSVRLRFAKAALSGSVYYWSVSDTRIFRIDDGTNQRVNFMPDPPTVSGPGGTANCIGCHTVSPSGRYLAGRMGPGENYGTVFDLTANLAVSPVPSLFPTTTQRWWFSSWNPSETRLVVANGPSPTSLALVDPFTGALIPAQGSGLPANNATHPSWAPDNSAIAYVTGASDWGTDYRDGALAVVPITGADSFGAPQTLLAGTAVPNADPMHRAISYPVWTPDSQRLVFAHGFSARSSAQPAQLYIVGRDGTGARALDNANAGQKLSFEPRFSPFDSGGYYWLAFLSRRDYGNAQAGTQGSNREQIWVTAIKKNPAPGEDPSEVAYWLPGQSSQSRNISAYWAPRACRQNGTGCGVNSECCSGECSSPGDGGAPVCSPPPPERCRVEGQTCSAGGDCCAGLTCDTNICAAGIN